MRRRLEESLIKRTYIYCTHDDVIMIPDKHAVANGGESSSSSSSSSAAAAQRTDSQTEANSGDTFAYSTPMRKTSNGAGGSGGSGSGAGIGGSNNSGLSPVSGVMRRNVSRGNLIADRAESKVLVIYAGGTIGMIRNETGGKSLCMCLCLL